MSTLDELLTKAGVGAIERNSYLGTVHAKLEAAGSTLAKISRVKDLFSATATAWDNIFDNLAEGSLAINLQGSITEPPPTVINPTTTGTPTPDGDIQVGSPFSATCTIAWPTAPQIGTNSIQMRTSCGGYSDRFLFVDIAYADRSLPVTPNHSTMRVQGTVADIVHDQMGFNILFVLADRITLVG